MKKRKFKVWWSIKTKNDASKVIKDCSYGFLFVAGLNIIIGLIINMVNAIGDGLIYLILGLLLLLLKSRLVAILLLLISAVGVVTTTLNKLGVLLGGENIILALIIFFVAVISVKATFKYHEFKKIYSSV